MAKLKRYKNFKSLKLDNKPDKTNSLVYIERHLALEDFINTLRGKLLEKRLESKEKKNHSSI